MEEREERIAAVIGRNIERELTRLGKTHDWLAKRINRERATVGLYVNRRRVPPPAILERISRVLRPEEGGSVDWLLGINPRDMTEEERTLVATYRRLRHHIYRAMLQDTADALLDADAALTARGVPPDA